jgi:hypothetical protein
VRTLEDQLDEACERYGLWWLVLPCEYETGIGAPEHAWRAGPWWCALIVSSGLTTNTRRWRRAFHYNLLGEVGRAEERMPEVAYIHPGPLGRKEAMGLLLAQLQRDL